MTLPLFNTAEGGSNTTTVAVANSGGASGTAFDAVTIGTNCFETFDNAQARDTLGYKTVIAATAAATRLTWQTATVGTQTVSVYNRIYLYATANPSGGLLLSGMRTGVSATLCAQLNITSSGFLNTQNAAGATLQTGSVAIALNAWNRIEWRVLPSTTVGVVEAWLYKGANLENDTTADDHIVSAATAVLGADIREVRLGMVSTPGTGSYTFWMDNLAVATAKLGPASPAAADLPYVVMAPPVAA